MSNRHHNTRDISFFHKITSFIRNMWASLGGGPITLLLLSLVALSMVRKGEWRIDSWDLLEHSLLCLTIGLATFIIERFLRATLPEAQVERGVVEPVDRKALARITTKLCEESSRYRYVGAIGKYARRHYLPLLGNNAQIREVEFSIYDPAASPGSYTSRGGRQPTRAWDDVRRDVLVTVITAYRWKYRRPTWDVCVSLHQLPHVLRYDIFDSALLITTASESDRPMLCASDSEMFEQWNEQIRLYPMKRIHLVRENTPATLETLCAAVSRIVGEQTFTNDEVRRAYKTSINEHAFEGELVVRDLRNESEHEGKRSP